MSAAERILTRLLQRYRATSIRPKLHHAPSQELAQQFAEESQNKVQVHYTNIYFHVDPLGGKDKEHQKKGPIYYVINSAQANCDLVIAKKTNAGQSVFHPRREKQGAKLQQLIQARTYPVLTGPTFDFMNPVPGDNLLDLHASIEHPWPALNWTLGCLVAESLVFTVVDIPRNIIVDTKTLRQQDHSLINSNYRTTALPICRIDLAGTYGYSQNSSNLLQGPAGLLHVFKTETEWLCQQSWVRRVTGVTVTGTNFHSVFVNGVVVRLNDIRTIYRTDRARFSGELRQQLSQEATERVIELIEKLGKQSFARDFVSGGYLQHLY